jgi:hypothetical protein
LYVRLNRRMRRSFCGRFERSETRGSGERLRAKGVGIGKVAKTLGVGVSYIHRLDRSAP